MFSKAKNKKIFKWIGISTVISVIIFFIVVTSMVLFSKTSTPLKGSENLNFNVLNTNKDKLPTLQKYTAKDGKELFYRYYNGNVDKTLIILHGSAYHSSYLQPLASYLSENNIANVYTPDLRGHGPETNNRGDVEYIGQLEDDLSDLVKLLRSQHEGPILLGGHSSGGGTVIRYAGGNNAPVDGYLMLAPYVHHTASTYRSENEWTNVNLPRIIGLDILNTFKITALNHKDVISFNMPEDSRNGTETLKYSYTLQTSMHPRDNYEQDIQNLDKPSFLMVGEDDNTFNTSAFAPLFGQYSPETKINILSNTSHFGVITKTTAHKSISNWLKKYYENDKVIN